MRRFATVALATTLFASSAYAAGNDLHAPLPAGKPAGVKSAQFEGTPTLLLVAGIGIVAAGIALAASGDNNSIVAGTTTTTTTTHTTGATGTTG